LTAGRRNEVYMTDDKGQIKSQVISHDGTEIAYFSSGEGPPLVLVHGGLADHTRWDALRPYLEPHFTLHAMDRRGRGASGDHLDYNIEREYEDVRAVIDAVSDASGSSVMVYGHSAGGYYVFGAATLTANIRKIILYEGWPPVNPNVWLTPPGFIERMEAKLAKGDREGVIELVALELANLTEEELDIYRNHPSWAARVAAAHTFPREERSFNIPFDREQALKISVPTLIVVGSESPDDWRAEAQDVAAAMPDARVAVIEGQGHGADVVAPELFTEAVLPFLEKKT
jgi:pimeloyl-ACP methyl ester carboxylesterase